MFRSAVDFGVAVCDGQQQQQRHEPEYGTMAYWNMVAQQQANGERCWHALAAELAHRHHNRGPR